MEIPYIGLIYILLFYFLQTLIFLKDTRNRVTGHGGQEVSIHSKVDCLLDSEETIPKWCSTFTSSSEHTFGTKRRWKTHNRISKNSTFINDK